METHPGKHLFIDDFFIESMQGTRRVLNHPQKLTVDAPLEIPMDRAWEAGSPRFQRVIYIEEVGRFRLYYTSWPNGLALVCALDSADGVTWEKPSLGLVEFEGSTDNNITNCPADELTITWDPHETDLRRRWKRLDNRPTGTDAAGKPQWRAHISIDGYDWQQLPVGDHSSQPMLFNFGAPPTGFGGSIDPDASYVFYSQRGSGRRTRVLGRRDSSDFLTWSGLRTVIDQDLEDPPGTEFYSAAADLANRTNAGLRILMLHTFHTDLNEPYHIQEPKQYWGEEAGSAALPARVDGPVDTQLAVSRDTASWTRWREPFIQRGAAGAWDWGMLYGDAPILHGEELYFFYSAGPQTHNGRTAYPDEGRYPVAKSWGKGLATLRYDGYVHVEAASSAPGQLTTHRFKQAAGGRVHVNVDATAGQLRYELLKDTGEPIQGFGLDDCDPLRGDAPQAELSWKGQRGWPAVGEDRRTPGLEDLPVGEFYIKLRFYLDPGAKLYSLTIDPPQVAVWGAPLPGRID
jgi:hypothetical protein